MDISTILTFAGGILAGLIVALKVIAPRTKNKTDDKILDYAEKVEDLVKPGK